MTGHEYHWQNNVVWQGIYQYNPADDGPECEAITRILAHHPRYVPGVEKRSNYISLLTSRSSLKKEVA